MNGQEKDDEIKGAGNSYDFGQRIYDPRLAKFLSTDRFTGKRPDIAPYTFAGNSPIAAIDIKGDSIYFVVGKQYLAAMKETILKMPSGKELWDEFANSSTANYYFAPIQASPSAAGFTIELSSGDVAADGKTVQFNKPFEYPDWYPAEMKEAETNPSTPAEIDSKITYENFAKAFNGIYVDTKKRNVFMLVNKKVSIMLHEMGAHAKEGATHDTFGNDLDFQEYPQFNTPGSPADKFNKELKKAPKPSGGGTTTPTKTYEQEKKEPLTPQ